MKALIGSDKPQARIDEFGGVITPKRAKFLHFVIDGEEIFTKRVVMPARPWLRPAVDNSGGKVQAAMQAAFAAQIRALVG